MKKIFLTFSILLNLMLVTTVWAVETKEGEKPATDACTTLDCPRGKCPKGTQQSTKDTKKTTTTTGQ